MITYSSCRWNSVALLEWIRKLLYVFLDGMTRHPNYLIHHQPTCHLSYPIQDLLYLLLTWLFLETPVATMLAPSASTVVSTFVDPTGRDTSWCWTVVHGQLGLCSASCTPIVD